MTRTSRTGVYRPSRTRRLADKVMGWLLRRGLGPGFMRLLTVRGRVTGQPRSTPVVPVRRDGHVWVVSPFGEVGWVRNARAAGRLELRRGADHNVYEIRELGAREAVPVLRAYLSMPSERFVRGDFEVTAASSDEAIAAEASRHPVFALDGPLAFLP
jgi:deazaflavin-dependent oxidoreductase (nitroreductase family)